MSFIDRNRISDLFDFAAWLLHSRFGITRGPLWWVGAVMEGAGGQAFGRGWGEWRKT